MMVMVLTIGILWHDDNGTTIGILWHDDSGTTIGLLCHDDSGTYHRHIMS